MRIRALAAALITLSFACATTQTSEAPAPAPEAAAPAAPEARPTAAEAKAFVEEMNGELKDRFVRSATAEWIRQTYITDDTIRAAAWANEEVLGYLSRANGEAKKYRALTDLDPDTERQLHLLRIATPLPAPGDPAKQSELATIAAELDSMYGRGKWCGPDGKAKCRDLEQLSETMRLSRDYDELLDAWAGWHTIARPMKDKYSRLVELSNEGARELDFQDLGQMWRAGYDMPPEEFEKEMDRLWNQVKPLYDELHCYVRAKLAKAYPGKVEETGPIPSHLLGNMWAQEWTNIYPLVEPYKGQGTPDVSAMLKKKNFDALKMVKIGEGFFTSMGLKPLPETFYERSMFVKPPAREVVCHASAWDVTYENDVRIKMCIKPTEEDFVTIHHELGHNYYYQYYHTLPILYQQGANDGFHEAIGDAIALSVTPEYLKQVGITDKVPAKSEKAVINEMMKSAIEKISFLPFGRMIDQWRWDVFSGKVKPADYQKHWDLLRLKYQGIAPPVARTEQDFDPGAKYHIPANTPYARYFLARILQFQFHKALCDAAGFKGPLHECSFYGNKDAGKRLQALLELGASKPWPDALEAMTGSRQMDGTALVEFFQPLRGYLQSQTKGMQCGW